VCAVGSDPLPGHWRERHGGGGFGRRHCVSAAPACPRNCLVTPPAFAIEVEDAPVRLDPGRGRVFRWTQHAHANKDREIALDRARLHVGARSVPTSRCCQPCGFGALGGRPYATSHHDRRACGAKTIMIARLPRALSRRADRHIASRSHVIPSNECDFICRKVAPAAFYPGTAGLHRLEFAGHT